MCNVRFGAPAKLPFAFVGLESSTKVCSMRPTAFAPIVATAGGAGAATAGAAATNAQAMTIAVDATNLPLPHSREPKAVIFAPDGYGIPAAR